MTLLAVDLGSSGCKAAILREGRILDPAARSNHSLLSGGDLSPDEALEKVEETIRRLFEGGSPAGAVETRSIDALVISSFLAFCFLDAEGAPVMPCAPYNDPRAAGALEHLTRAAGGMETFLAITGRRPAAELAASHLCLLRTRDPGAFERLRRISSLKDLLLERLTGADGIDLIHANYTGLLEIHRRQPWDALLRELRLPADLLGTLQEPGAIAGYLSGEAARRLGLPPGLPVVRGSIDGSTAMYGAGVLLPGTATMVCGTTDVIMAWTGTAPRGAEGARRGGSDARGMGDSRRGGSDARGGLTTNSALGGGYLTGGSTALSGGLLRQLEELFGVDGLSLQQRIAGVPVGAEGLRMLPGIAGERAPFWRPEARGEVRGWRVEHRREHFFRAAMEATAYRAARLVGEMIATGLSLSTVRLAGGGSAMPLWNRIRAGAFGQVGVPETVVCSSGEATLVGSAIFSELALAGGDPEQVSRVWVPEVAPVEPPATEGQASLAAEYDRMFTELEAGA